MMQPDCAHAEREASELLAHLPRSAVTGEMMRQCNALAVILHELIRDSGPLDDPLPNG